MPTRSHRSEPRPTALLLPTALLAPGRRRRTGSGPAGSAGVLALLTGAFFGHFGWPLIALVLSRLSPAGRPTPPAAPAQPEVDAFVSVVIPAYKESRTIGRTVINLLEAENTPVREVIVVADDDEQTADRAREAGATVLTGASRKGKSSAINRGVQRAGSDVIVLLDANARSRSTTSASSPGTSVAAS